MWPSGCGPRPHLLLEAIRARNARLNTLGGSHLIQARSGLSSTPDRRRMLIVAGGGHGLPMDNDD